MGWFGNATIFAQEPDWKGLESLPFAMRAYRHGRKPVWVVDVYDPSDGTAPSRAFFQEAPVVWAKEKSTQHRLSSEVRAVLDRVAEIERIMGPYSAFLIDYRGYLPFVAEMARRAKAPAYYFAASDNLDIGCLAGPERFERFACQCEYFVMEYHEGTLTLAQRSTKVADRLSRCAELEGVALRPLTREDRRRIAFVYGFSADLWPKEMQPAKKALKIDTGVAFDYFEENLQLVAERLSNDKSPLEIRPLDKKPARPRGLKADKVDLSRNAQEFRFRDGELMVYSNMMSGGRETFFVDVSGWPPKIERLPEHVRAVDRSRGGRWVMLTQFSKQFRVGRREVWRHEVRLRDDFSGEFKTLACGGPNPELGVSWVGFLGERVVANPYNLGDLVERELLVQSGSTLGTLEGAPKVQGFVSPCVVRLGDGADVLWWESDGYELNGDEFVRTFDLGPKPAGGWAVPWGEDGFFYLSRGQLFEVRRGEPPRQHAPWLENINTLTAGPEGALLLHEYYDWKKKIGEIYFPADGTVIRLGLPLVKEEEPRLFQALHWLPATNRLLIDAAVRFWSLPGEFVLSLPREKPAAPATSRPPRNRAPRPDRVMEALRELRTEKQTSKRRDRRRP